MGEKVLGKFDVLKATELKRELVPVPEWGGSVWVQEMDAATRDRFDAWVVKKESNEVGGMRLRVLIATVINEDGTLMFSDLDIPDLMSKSSRATSRLSDVGMILSGMNEEAAAATTKNSKPVPNDDSSSDSVVN